MTDHQAAELAFGELDQVDRWQCQQLVMAAMPEVDLAQEQFLDCRPYLVLQACPRLVPRLVRHSDVGLSAKFGVHHRPPLFSAVVGIAQVAGPLQLLVRDRGQGRIRMSVGPVAAPLLLDPSARPPIAIQAS